MDRCQWKLKDSNEFIIGMKADRCDENAVAEIVRPQRKTDFCLCENHFNEFVKLYGLNHPVRFLNRGDFNEYS